MKYLNRYVAILFLLFFLYYLTNFLNLIKIESSNSPDVSEISNDFESLKLKIDYLQNLVDMKQKDIDSLKNAFTYNIKYYNELVDKQREILNSIKNSTILNSSQHFMINNMTQALNHSMAQRPSSSGEQELFAHAIKSIPHLNGQINLLTPKFLLSKNRQSSIVIGVPTIKREKTSYLLETLKSLLDAMNDVEKADTLVVIIIAELEDQNYIQDTVEQISKVYKYEVDSGLFDIIVPPNEFYPNLNDLKADKVFNDSAERVKWRTKQNYDFSYLMAYAQRRGEYYLQLEDDVVAKANFITTIKTYIEKQKERDWMIIEFSKLGFIGKLFRCQQLPLFVNFFLLFAHDKPIDWLYDLVLDIKICNPEKGQSHCLRSKDELKLRFKPSLFQHVGTQSSLKGKTQKLKDKDFGKQMLIVAHNNPVAKVSTSLKTYMKNTLESAYLGQNFFWSMAPSANDYILFEFKEPASIKKYYVKSGNPEHPDDKLYNASLQIKPVRPIEESKVPKNYVKTKDDFYIIDTFSETQIGVASGFINSEITGPLSQIRIQISETRETWVIISEISFSTTVENTKPAQSKMISLR